MSTEATQVIGLNFSDAGPGDSLSAAVLEVACAAARVSQVPTERIGAQASLAALRDSVAQQLPELGALVGSVLALIETAGETVERAG